MSRSTFRSVLFLLAAVAIIGFAKTNDGATSAALAASSTASGAVAHGKSIFAQDCASCHGTTGAGGVGPSLKGEKARKDLAAAIAWIKNPKPPMPKLYPSPLGDKDVAAVAAYVETL